MIIRAKAVAILALTLTGALPLCAGDPFLRSPLLDAHNCYPEKGEWSDRLDRALKAGFPIGIEQDLAWFDGKVVVSHTEKTTGVEPTLKAHFFEKVRPIIERALRENRREQWPLIVVHFDFKDNRPEILKGVWELLGEYQSWITTAEKTSDPKRVSPFEVKPLLVLTETPDVQEEVFFRSQPVGSRLRIFGSAATRETPSSESREERERLMATMPPEHLVSAPANNYRRWWNLSWHNVEQNGQNEAGEWTAADDRRLRALVDHAHKLGYWIRFYTLDGFPAGQGKGWSQGYNFGTLEAATARWKASIAAGVDLIATDQYEELAKLIKR